MLAGAKSTACYYEVELTGSDWFGRSFADRATLEWAEDTGKVLHSRRKLTCGATIFIKLLLWQGRNSSALPYKVARVVEATRTSWIVYLAALDETEQGSLRENPGANCGADHS